MNEKRTEAQDINARIAKYFGFEECKKYKVSHFVYGGKKLSQWAYPNDWYMAQGEIPNMAIPDFLTILEDYMKLMKKHGGRGETEYFGGLIF